MMRIEKISLKSSEMTDYTLISQEGTAGIPYATDSIYRNATNPRVLIRVVLIPFQTESEALEHLELFCNDMISSDLAQEQQDFIEVPGCTITGIKGFSPPASQQEKPYSALFVKGNLYVNIANVGEEYGDITPFLACIGKKLDSRKTE
ncbi:hypothetical protein E1J02_04785 [Phocaeicola dorei]|uniref:hypothetical protein n=1 Tax=Bacteroides ovatus TaxID=28116 RepID=UPI0002EC9A10|nr:hypothetical protein [Bacteroides ovatus]TDA83876.1 hypothetical protein E1J05_00475 [Phocaeicola dorei]TDA91357.1 hypothetical protein E1J02_04785 [Phocaeicola dorei]